MKLQRFTPDDSAIILIDHQIGLLECVTSKPHDVIRQNCNVAIKFAKAYDLPLFVTSGMHDVCGGLIKEVKEEIVEYPSKLFSREGGHSCWSNPALKEALLKQGRRNLFVGGLLTDVNLFWSVFDAIQLGFSVKVVSGLCGSPEIEGDRLTYDRLFKLDVTVLNASQMISELVPDFSSDYGAEALKILMQDIIAKQ